MMVASLYFATQEEVGVAVVGLFLSLTVFAFASGLLIQYDDGWGEISEKVNEYVQIEGGLDSAPKLDAEKIVDGIEDSTDSFHEETIKFEIDGEPYMATLVFSMKKERELEIGARSGSTGAVQPWNAAVALGSGVESIESGNTAPINEMDARVSTYLQENGGLDEAPLVNVAAEIEELAENKIQSFRKVVNLTLDGQVYPTTLVFSLDGTGALDIEIAAGGSTVPLSPAAIVEAQTADSGKIIVIDE